MSKNTELLISRLIAPLRLVSDMSEESGASAISKSFFNVSEVDSDEKSIVWWRSSFGETVTKGRRSNCSPSPFFFVFVSTSSEPLSSADDFRSKHFESFWTLKGSR